MLDPPRLPVTGRVGRAGLAGVVGVGVGAGVGVGVFGPPGSWVGGVGYGVGGGGEGVGGGRGGTQPGGGGIGRGGFSTRCPPPCASAASAKSHRKALIQAVFTTLD